MKKIMGNETHVDGRWIYSKLRVCGHLKVIERLYNDWIRTNASLVGFTCETTGDKTEEKMKKIDEFIANHQLPVCVEDQPTPAKRFKIKIVK